MTEAEKKYFVARCNKDLVVREDTLLEIDTDEEAEFLVEALKKQIPKKTITSGNFFIVQRCPVCDEYVPTEAIYCMKCGQKLKREEKK